MCIVIEMPEELKSVSEAVAALVQRVQAAWRSTRGGKALAYAEIEQHLAESVAAIERAAHQVVLQAVDIDQPAVQIEGKEYRRVGRYPGTYYTMAGPVEVPRTLYRERGQRNAKTVNAISLRCGVVGEGWLPGVAQAMAYQLQHGTSREAAATAQQLGRLPYARSSFEAVGHEVGRQYTAVRLDVEESLIEDTPVPAEACSISVALDRVSVPLEEPLSEARPGEAPKVCRQFRFAYCAPLTFHDRTGEAVQTLRYGRMPHEGGASLCHSLADTVQTVLRKRPDLQVSLLADGAPELWGLLEGYLNRKTLGVPVHSLVDLWHVVEKLGSAARVLYGEAQAGSVLQSWKLRLLNQPGSAAVIRQELVASEKAPVWVGARRPVHEAITYLENHRARMNYAGARQRGLPVGSGNVEATCKSLVALRMKRPGARWKEVSGAQVLNLRALALSDYWEAAMMLTLRPLRKAVRVRLAA